ncbi:hypothetical protein FSP39_014789 [Pinctada imbricata]|uniref:Coiled-coil domain-containing protein 15 n=1 Tax=Pinctada imbricata TaxID=66713 RepID=A0AA89C1F4_PINIB|nr:hypothetical protein FSP39_014789 [Pinctada imbricata]
MQARKISKPVISSDVMGNRNVEIRAVGAWVQPEMTMSSEGVIAAQEAEARMRRLHLEKEERLRKFKDDVKARVRIMETVRRQQELAKSYQATEQECKVLKQSAFSENLMPRKDSCTHRRNHALVANSQKYVPQQAEELKYNDKGFKDHSKQVHTFTSQARGRLVSKQIVGDSFSSDYNQEDSWKIHISQNVPSKMSDEKDVIIIPNGEEEDDDDIEECPPEDNMAFTRAKTVQFDLESNEVHVPPSRVRKKQAWNSQPRRTNKVPNIYSGVREEEERKQLKLQQATYRRLFMDIEREQVKENIRRKDHKKKIEILKKEKEALRRQEEDHSHELLEPRDPLTGESSMESLQREIEEHQYIREVMRENKYKIQKVKEMERFLEALKHQLKDKMDKKGVELAPLCCCGTSVWDTNPETCANNCVFYRNPKGYARALQSLLVSSEIS